MIDAQCINCIISIAHLAPTHLYELLVFYGANLILASIQLSPTQYSFNESLNHQRFA